MSLRFHSPRLTISLLAGILLAGAPQLAEARGGNGAGDSSAAPSLQAERRKLVGDLERANADIEQLKKKERGVREDYRLRARMADAEAIARRLTELDAQLSAGTQRGGAPAARPVEPMVEPAGTDGPAEWEARADILTDQSRRLAAQAATLNQRVSGLRSRMELRRRAGQLESDPFAPMEGSKRRLIAGLPSGPVLPTAAGAKDASAGGAASGPTSGRGVSAPPPSSNSNAGGAAPLAPSLGGSATVTPAAMTPGSAGVPEAVSAGNSNAGNHGGLLPPTPVASGSNGSAGGPGDGAGSLSAQLRDFLDPTALATIRKLELAGTPVANLEAMERAAAALAERAHKLQSQSDSLRQRARIAH